jgi:hypothetical protein
MQAPLVHMTHAQEPVSRVDHLHQLENFTHLSHPEACNY